MSARDKLAEIINEYMEVDIPESVPDKHIPTGADYGLADEIIEAGWRLPMLEITTVEELEALPNNEERAIPQEAVEAACNAFQRPNRMLINTSDGNLKGRLEAAFEAAEPHLRKKWAEEEAAKLAKTTVGLAAILDRFLENAEWESSGEEMAQRIIESVQNSLLEGVGE